jgi:cyanophycinase
MWKFLAASTLCLTVTASRPAPRVGPEHGAVLVVGGGAMGPELWGKFVELAGGPDAVIVDVPTAGGDSTYPADWRGTRGLKEAGARHVVVLHTIDRAVANSDSFAAPLRQAGGVWFEGGRQWHLVDSYAGTKTEQAFHEVLTRGGVVGGSSAGASILASFLVRGARAGNTIMVAPRYETGFGFLRGVGIDQHVVARERLADLADSVMPRFPELLGMSEDEGTAWLVQGDTATIMGRNKAFVYGGHDATDSGKPFLTLHPGDRYDLGARHVISRAIDDSPLTDAFIDSVFAGVAAEAAVVVAEGGEVYVDRSYHIPPQPRYMPTTTLPQFSLGGLSDGYLTAAALLLAHDGKLSLDDSLANGTPVTVREYLSGSRPLANGGALLAQLIADRAGTSFPRFIAQRVFTPVGAHRTVAGDDGRFEGDVDELYRWALGLDDVPGFTAAGTDRALVPVGGGTSGAGLGWRIDTYRGQRRVSEFGAPGGFRNALVRFPDRRAVVIIVSNADGVNAGALADRITDRLFAEH